MSEFQIFSDGSCDLTLELAAQYKIITIPFYISLNQTDYFKELVELPIDDFYNKIISERIYPKTSLPSVQDYINAFTPALDVGKDVLCYTITDTLSGSYQSASTAKIMLEETYPNSKIIIVNTWLATGAQALLLKEVSQMQADGLTIDEVAEKSELIKKTGRIFFMVGTLNYLEHGGRIGKLTSLSGKILNIKPLIELKNGEINVAGVSQSRKKGLKKLASLSKSHFEKSNENANDYTFTIGTTNTWEEIDIFQQAILNEVSNCKFIAPFRIGATIATHTGPDTIGLCFIKKYKSL